MIAASLLTFAGTAAALAVSVAQASPWLAWPCAASFVVLVAGLFLALRGAPLIQAERARREVAQDVVSELLELRDTLALLLDSVPNNKTHEVEADAWHLAMGQALTAADYLARESQQLRQDERFRIYCPSVRPESRFKIDVSDIRTAFLVGSRGREFWDVLRKLELAHAGLAEAAQLHAKNAGLE